MKDLEINKGLKEQIEANQNQLKNAIRNHQVSLQCLWFFPHVRCPLENFESNKDRIRLLISEKTSPKHFCYIKWNFQKFSEIKFLFFLQNLVIKLKEDRDVSCQI